jgi:hypothetical protein
MSVLSVADITYHIFVLHQVSPHERSRRMLSTHIASPPPPPLCICLLFPSVSLCPYFSTTFSHFHLSLTPSLAQHEAQSIWSRYSFYAIGLASRGPCRHRLEKGFLVVYSLPTALKAPGMTLEYASVCFSAAHNFCSSVRSPSVGLKARDCHSASSQRFLERP